ncbi:MAG: GerMN domain-containing protein [Christensenellales bacterium]
MICLLLSILILLSAALSGCGRNGAVPPSLTQEADSFDPVLIQNTGSVVSLPLYFSDANGKRVLSETREVTLDKGQTAAQRAIMEMIKGPSLETLYPVLPDQTELLDLEITRNVANIYFSAAFLNMSATEQMKARVALSCALYDTDRVEYINIFTEGKLLGYLGQATGLLRYRTYAGDLSQLMEKMDALSTARRREYTVALYYADLSGQYFMPEIRTVLADQEQLTRAVVEELLNLPGETAMLQSFAGPDTVFIEDPVITSTGTGGKIATLNLSKRPAFTSGVEQTAQVYYGALAYTLAGAIPNLEGVVIKYNGEIFTELTSAEGFSDGLIRPDFFGEYVGNTVKLYFPDQGRSKLHPVYRPVQQSKADTVYDCLIEMMRGPLSYETENVWPVLPAGISRDDLLRVMVNMDVSYVDFSANFYEKCKTLTRQNEYLLVYAIVNTVTEAAGTKRMQFLCDGARRETIAGSISIRNPLMGNPGLVAQK